jgi:hypothetical protein
MDLDNAGITLGLFNDDGMGPYNRIDMFVPIDNLKYVTTGVSPSGLWNMDDNMVDGNIAQLSFTPMYGGVNVGQGAQEAFGLGIDENLFKADHGGQGYADWVNALNEMSLYVNAYGSTIEASDKYTVGTPVPEPAGLILLLSGLAAFAGFGRKKRT